MNKATRANVAALGAIFGLSGMSHGFFEVLQGNTPTGGLFISAIGEKYRMWPHGNEFAITLIPNFLVTGLAAMIIGLTIILWSFGFVHKKNGATVLLLLFIALLLVGGGVAQLLFFPWIWLVSTQINKPLVGWEKILPIRVQKPLSKLWSSSLITGSILLVMVLVIGITGYLPGMKDPETVLTIMLACLIAVVIVLPLVFVSGYAHDIVMGREPALEEK